MAAVGDAGGLPGVLPVIGAVIANLAANAAVVQAWRRVLTAAGVDLRWRPAAWVWALSQLTRYTVGAAQVAGRAVAGRRWGVTATAGAVTALVEVAWQFSITATLALVTVPWWLPGTRSLAWLAWAGLVPAAVLLFGLARPQSLVGLTARTLELRPLRWLARGRLDALQDRVAISHRAAGEITLLYLLNTGLRVAAFLLLFAAVGGDVGAAGLLAVGGYAVGQLAGRLAVFAPGGLGPREGATALVVASAIGGGPALVLVASVRVAEIVAELLFFGAARLTRAPRRSPWP